MEEKIMSLVKFSDNYPTIFDRFFDNDWFDWGTRNFSSTNTTLPSVNIKENTDAFEVEVAAPGFCKDDFRIELNHDVLTISSEKKVENESKDNQKFTRREFSYQSFSRSFTLPNIADSDRIEAKYDNGILQVSIPKKEKTAISVSRQIAIS